MDSSSSAPPGLSFVGGAPVPSSSSMEEADGVAAPMPRQRRLLSLVRPWQQPEGGGCCGRNGRLCCCCLSCGRPNKILPVTVAPTDCDFLEIRPHRRIRVIHQMGKTPAGAVVGGSSLDGRALHRSATTISRGDDDEGLRVRLPSPVKNAVESDEDEDYWFENAAPRRMPIKPVDSRPPVNRIFNKFEPQKPPSIAGINPPKAALAREAAEGGGRDDDGQAVTPLPPGQQQQRLQRKVIVPVAAIDPDDEEDLVREDPDEDENGDDSSPGLQPVVGENFVASVLADMSDLVLNITADATDSKPGSPPPQTDTAKSEESASTPQSHPPLPVERSSPTPDGKMVRSRPDPEGDGSSPEHDLPKGTVVVTGGNLGGMANVAFEGDEEYRESEEKESVESTKPHQVAVDGDATDAGYSRERDMELLLSRDGQGREEEEEEDLESGGEPPSSSSSENIRMRNIPSKESEEAETHSIPSTQQGLAAAQSDGAQQQQAFHHNSDSSNVINNQQSDSNQPALRQSLLPCLFFVHGVGGSATTWATQLEYFTDRGYEVIAPDLLGHGFSSAPDNPRSYTFSKLFRDVLTIFDHYVRPDRPCCVIAHSYGSSFAAALARSRPASVQTLLLLASGGPTPLAPPPVIKTIPSSFVAACLKPFLRCGFRRQQQYNASSSGAAGGKGKTVVRGKAMKFQEAFDVPAYVFKHIMAGQNWPEGDASFHRRITAPTLLVYGLKDPFVSLVEMCEMERTIPRSFLELLPLSGHMVMLDQPRELNAMMRRFIEKYNQSPQQQQGGRGAPAEGP